MGHLGHRHRPPAAPTDRRTRTRAAFLSTQRPGPHRLATTDPRDQCPETGRARLGYDRARTLLGRHADGLRLHQLRHSPATHLGEANVPTNVIMAKTGHKSLRSVQRYVNPGLAAIHQATQALAAPRRRD
ncbi:MULTISPECIES: tyrosine-type recombinase/integrase [Actinosynnema]|uniref:tyrosine-type recombinase/integrase n=1 Tax=Actinosynnema TaxID=40566 RepID=UPI0020A55BCE|nr:tyrosine-type recombinase/integrase [Actinosynnema pretiosum]MCP2095573.1 Phage integrase family protein [Actinosynnema pretiosum]